MDKVDRITQLVAAQVAGGRLEDVYWEDIIWRAVCVDRAIAHAAKAGEPTLESIRAIAQAHANREGLKRIP